MKKVTVDFNENWIITRQGDEKTPVEAFAEYLSKKNNVRILGEGASNIFFIITDEFTQEKDVRNWVNEFVMFEYMILPDGDIAKILVEEYVEQVVRNATMSLIHRLVGAWEFKQLAEEITAVAPGLIKHNSVEALTRQAYVFSINDGDGYTTYLKHFALLLDEVGVIKLAKPTGIYEFVVPPKTRENPTPFKSVEGHLISKSSASESQIISIDIREWLNSVQSTDFKSFLKFVDRNARKNIIIFRVPFVEKDVLETIRESIEDVLCVRTVAIAPFDIDELERCAQNTITRYNYIMEKGAWRVFRQRINEEKNDGRFYGINTVNKVVREIIYLKHLHNAEKEIDDVVIKAAEIKKLTHGTSNEKSGLALLDEKIGMESIKKRIEEIVAQIKVLQNNNGNLGSPCIHMRFVGNPGTGKTTAARIIGQVLREQGILRNGNFFEYNGRDFCGQYVGETAPKTAAKCRDAYGSVLFIDEAYSLYRDTARLSNDFGKEAIDTLISEMENHRNDLVVIMAGYPDEMETLMEANKGLESRMPFIIEFPNYTREQLFEIFMLMVNKNFKYADGFKEAAKEFFMNLKEEFIADKKFSNARFVRNVFERTWGKAAMRTQFTENTEMILTKEDFILASTDKEFEMNEKPSKKGIGFVG